MRWFNQKNRVYVILSFVLLMLLAGCTSIRPGISIDDITPVSHTRFSYKSYARLLDTYVNEHGRVNYNQLVKQPADVDLMYAQIAAYSPDSHPELFPDENAQLAYWINSYNLTTIKGVLHRYPITSVADVSPPAVLFFFPSKSGFFFFQRFTYGGAESSLYGLENKVIRERFTDPRYHFALNCASKSCPELPRIPFYPQTLDKQLDAEAVAFINDENNVRYDPQEKTLYLSSIFKWYEEDFLHWLTLKNPGSVPHIADYLMLFLDTRTATLIKKDLNSLVVEYNMYDWGLNDVADE